MVIECVERAARGAVALMLTTMFALAAGFDPPPTPARPVVDTVHGVKLTDDYRWLEDGRSPEVQAWTQAPARGNARLARCQRTNGRRPA